MAIRLRLIYILVGVICILLLTNAMFKSSVQRYSQVTLPEEHNLTQKPPLIRPERIKCYEEPSTHNSFPELDAVREQKFLSSDKNIFFLETSCFQKDGYARLNYRQACSIESAARMNPNMSVTLFYLSPSPPSNLTKKLTECLYQYNNVQVRRVKVADYVRNTLIENWYADGKVLSTSLWPNVHMSDFLRVLTLWKYGGIYLDLDVIVMTSLDNLTNFIGTEKDSLPAAGVFGFTRTGLGRNITAECLNDLMETYRGDSWCNSSVGVMTRVTKKQCRAEHFKDMTLDRCGGFQVFPPPVFYPIHWSVWQRFFTTEESIRTMELINASRAVHMWNALSKNSKVVKGCPYLQLAKKCCPVVYSYCNGEF